MTPHPSKPAPTFRHFLQTFAAGSALSMAFAGCPGGCSDTGTGGASGKPAQVTRSPCADKADGTPAIMSIVADKGGDDAIRSCLAAGSDVNARDKAGRTALMQAALANEDALPALIAAGADLNLQDKDGLTALIIASTVGTDATVKQLVNAHADLNAQDRAAGWTALMFACIQGHESVVRLLMDAKAPLDAQDKVGLTALMHASARGWHGIVQLLVDAGANRELKDSDGRTALDLAADAKVEQILKGGSVQATAGKPDAVSDDAKADAPADSPADAPSKPQASPAK